MVCLVSIPAGAVTIDMVTVGNPGNANDTGGGLIGRVDYTYQIGKYDVTIGQYTAFLNAVDPNGTNPNNIWNSQMQYDRNVAGISYNAAAAAGSKYAIMGPAGYVPTSGVTAANRPITWVSWFDAARFANWMTNGQGGPGTTETGAYDLASAAPGVAPAKTPGAAFYIPSQDEWYKAAYYSPTLNGGSGGYYSYPTQSNTAPGNAIGSGVNQANYKISPEFKYAVTQSSAYDSNQNYLTDVGAFTNSASFYGTFDQGGNVFQWNDQDGQPSLFRGARGGDWRSDGPNNMLSSGADSLPPSVEDANVGFRLASPVPEIDPNGLSAALGLLVGGLGILERRRCAR